MTGLKTSECLLYSKVECSLVGRGPPSPRGWPAERAKLIPLPRWADRSQPDQLYKYNERTTAREGGAAATDDDRRGGPPAAEAGRQAG